jgi:hypothetical protein
MPALVLPAYVDDDGEVPEQKARNGYGAVCTVFESWGKRVWNGMKVFVPEEHRVIAKSMMWW